jgi:ankyrin repeat protein
MVHSSSVVRWIAPLLSLTALADGADLRLLEAVENRDSAAVHSLLNQHVDVNASRVDGATALFWAVHWNDLETTDLLLRAGANARASDDLGGTPLSLACSNRNSPMVERLLKAGADPKAALKTGETVLMTCAGTGAVDAVQLLLARGAEVNAKDTRLGQTALMWAAAEKHADVTRVLLGRGADVHARAKSGFAPLLFAARSGDLESARMLIAAGANVNDTAVNGMTPVLMASASGHEALSVFLLENGANPNVTADPNGITPLHYALQKGISALRDFGADEAHSFGFYYRPDMDELVKALVKHGANLDARLVDHPAEMEGSNHISWLAGATPFVLAAAVVDVAAMRALAAGGADVRARAGNGMTGLMLVARLGAKPPALTADLERNALEAAKVAAESGSDVDAVDGDGQTALHLAAAKGMDTLVQFLVDQGAKVSAKDKNGLTPLDRAEGIEGGNGDAPQVNRRAIHKSTAELLRKLGGVGGGVAAGARVDLDAP